MSHCRTRGLEKVLQAGKLILVLDLDHTLLNSTGLHEVNHFLSRDYFGIL